MHSEHTGQLRIESSRLKKLFFEIGLYNPNKAFYKERIRKYQQVFNYISQIKTALNKLSTKRPIVMLDCGCGKSYLSFILYEYCTNVLHRKVKIIGIDNNIELITKCKNTADELNYTDLKFFATDVEGFSYAEPIDIVYSLHACNTATDQTIAKGVQLNAKYIFSVSCCQHNNRANISKHPLTSITRHYPYKERLVDMLGDGMRGLLLEHLGYGIKIFEFITAEYTPKNIILRAIKNSVKKQDKEIAMQRYKQLVELFHFSPALEGLLKNQL